MPIKIGVIMDPIDTVNYHKDSTLAMLWAAKKKGWELFYMEQADLFINSGEARAHVRSLEVFENPEHWFKFGASSDMALGDLDVILMRKDPPFDMNFIYTTYFLDLAERDGALIVNKPQSLRNFNEKVFATHFPHCCAPTLVSQQAGDLKTFVEQHEKTIFKPLDGMGGASIFRVDLGQPNINVIIETLTQNGRMPIMAQKFIPEISKGDKRILLIDGEAIPFGLARIPAKGEVRGNLAAGGTGVAVALSEHDYWLVEQVAPSLKANGLLFVGMDVIGDYITEINVTSPTCIREIDTAHNTEIAHKLMDKIQEKLDQAR